ncbi:HET-domain-containing protein [Rhizopogon salebrosus TDB-379]|nr:HET-domain-containing protein [Rhizopogon salebrosus TDB-379]
MYSRSMLCDVLAGGSRMPIKHPLLVLSTIHPIILITRSPTSSSAGKHRAPRLTLLEYVSTFFRRNRTKDSNECPALSTQMGEILPPTYNDDDAPLCSVCSALDLRAMLHDGVLKERALPLGLLTDIFDKHDQCGLCRLMAIVIRRNWYLDKRPGINIAGITCALYADACGDLNIPGGVSPTSDRPEEVAAAIVVAQSSLLLEIQLLEEDASKFGRTKGLHGRRVSQTVDIGLLKRWIHTCENEHREKCEAVWWRDAREVLPKCVRVLDVTRMAIVPAPRSCRYVALSYIWGGPGEDYWTTRANVKQRSRRGGLHISVLPVTIRDTIQLVRQVGERYLWIDALCIVQDDLADNTTQIGVMDLIYGSSVFTVFAAGGASVRDPLPGIRPGTRNLKQDITQIKGLHLAVPFVLPGAAVTSSEWNTRGWTYQEFILSRRCIFFTSNQMHFECMADIFGEDIIAERINFPWLSHPLQYSGLGKFTQRGVVRSRSQSVERLHQSVCEPEYMTMVETYTLRRLTRESDIMNAFTALINAMTKGYHWAGGDPGKAFWFGMPLGDLELALVWQPAANASHERRLPADGDMTAWPSWSWAAWKGAVRYDGYGGEVLAKEHARSPPGVQQSLVEQWNIVDGDGKLVRLDVRRTGRKGDGVHWALYVPPKGDIDAGQLVRENAPLLPGTLVFRTSSAHFNVTKADDFIDAGVETKCMFYVMVVQKMQNEERLERLGVGFVLILAADGIIAHEATPLDINEHAYSIVTQSRSFAATQTRILAGCGRGIPIPKYIRISITLSDLKPIYALRIQ